MAVYFITAREVGRVKIGYTTGEPRDRFNWISANSPVAVALEAVVEGGREEERAFHVRFAAQRAKGEWFRLCSEIEEIIAANPFARPDVGRARIEYSWGSVARFVCDLGGLIAVSDALDIPYTTLATWRQKDSIPHYRLDPLIARAAALGVDVPADILTPAGV